MASPVAISWARYPEATDGCTEFVGVRVVEQLDDWEMTGRAKVARASILFVANLMTKIRLVDIRKGNPDWTIDGKEEDKYERLLFTNRQLGGRARWQARRSKDHCLRMECVMLGGR